MSTAIESSTREGEEAVSLPPDVKIGALSEKFKAALESSPAEASKAAKEKAAAAPPAEIKIPQQTEPQKPAAKAPDDKKEAKIPREHFRALEQQRDEFKTKWEATEKQAREFEAKVRETEAKIPKDYGQLQERLKQFEGLQKRLDVEHSEEFKAAFDNKIKGSIEQAREIIGAEGADAIVEILTAAPSKRLDAELEKLTEGLPAVKQHAISNLWLEVRRLQKERSAVLANADAEYQNWKKAKDESGIRERANSKQVLDNVVSLVLGEAGKKIGHFQRKEGDAEHNAHVAENENMLRELATADLTPELRGKTALWAVLGYRAATELQARDGVIAQLRKELAEIQGASPSVGGEGKGKQGDGKLTAFQKYTKAMNEGVPAKE